MSLSFLLNYPIFSFSNLPKENFEDWSLPTFSYEIPTENIIGITDSFQAAEFLFQDTVDNNSALSLISEPPLYRLYSSHDHIIRINKKKLSKVLIVIGESIGESQEIYHSIADGIITKLIDNNFIEVKDLHDFINEESNSFFLVDFNTKGKSSISNLVNLLKSANSINYFESDLYIKKSAVDILVYVGDACADGWHFFKDVENGEKLIFGIDYLRNHLANSFITIPFIIDFSDNCLCHDEVSHPIFAPMKLEDPYIENHMHNIYYKAFSFTEKYNGIPFSSYYVGNICLIDPFLSSKIYEKLFKSLLKLNHYPSIESVSKIIKITKKELKSSFDKYPDSNIKKGVKPKLAWNSIFGFSPNKVNYEYTEESVRLIEDESKGNLASSIDGILSYIERSMPNYQVELIKRKTAVYRSFLLSFKHPKDPARIFLFLLRKISNNLTEFKKQKKIIKQHINELKKQYRDITIFVVLPNENIIPIEELEISSKDKVHHATYNSILNINSPDFSKLNSNIALPKINVKPTIEEVYDDFDVRLLKNIYNMADQKFIENFISEKNKHILVLLGEASYGKSHFLKQICRADTCKFKIKNSQRFLVFIEPEDCLKHKKILQEGKVLLQFIWKRLSELNIQESDVEILIREGVVIPVFDALDEICSQCGLDPIKIIDNFKGIMSSETETDYKVIFSSRTAFWSTFFHNEKFEDTAIYKIKGFNKQQINEYIGEYLKTILVDENLTIDNMKREVGHLIKHFTINDELSPLILVIIFDAYERDLSFEFTIYDDIEKTTLDDPWLYLIKLISEREIKKHKLPIGMDVYLMYLSELAKDEENAEDDSFSSKQIAKCFKEYLSDRNIVIHTAILTSHLFFIAIPGTDRFAYRHLIIKNYLLYHRIRNKIMDQLESPENFFVSAYSTDSFFKELINRTIFGNDPIAEEDLIVIIQLLLEKNESTTREIRGGGSNAELGFHLIESYLNQKKSLTYAEKNSLFFSKILPAKRKIIENIAFEYQISKIDFSNIVFRNCTFGSKFTFEKCQLGNVKFEDCYFKSPINFDHCGRKDRIVIENFRSSDINFKALMKSRYEITFFEGDTFEDVKNYAITIFSKFFDDNYNIIKISRHKLIFDNPIFNLILKEFFREWDSGSHGESIFHISNGVIVKIKREYKSTIMEFIRHGIVNNKLQNYLLNIIKKLN